MRRPIFFPELLRDILIDQELTPSRLAAAVHLKPETIESWLSASSMPKAASVWTIARALGGREQDLLASALAWYHQRTESMYPLEVLSLAKSASAYLGEMNWWERVPEPDQEQFLAVWSRILEDKVPELALPEGETTSSNLIVLPIAPLLVVDEWAEIVESIKRDDSSLYQLPWKRFEDLIAELLNRYGWETTPMGYTKDDGIDIVAARRIAPDLRFTMMVQCKRFAKTRSVGVEIVKEVWSVKWEKGFHQAMIATTSTFTRSLTV
jgi:transcriptional regulator with XRE-family HTH domain